MGTKKAASREWREGKKKAKTARRTSREYQLKVDGGDGEEKAMSRHNPDSQRRPNSLFALVPRAHLE